MADLLSNSVSALISYQTALTTTSHNVANVNTAGFSRQKADLATRPGQATGAGYFGNGVNVTGVNRMYDGFAVGQVRTNTSLSMRLDTYYNYASQVDNLLADPSAGMSPVLQSFFDAMQGVANNPSSTPARQVLLSQSQTLVDRFHSVNDRLLALREEINTALRDTVGQINSLATSIAGINHEVVIGLAQSGGQPPNDLLDQRDELIRQLSELVPVSTVAQDDGALNVFIGKGQTLVLGDKTNLLATTQSPYDANRLEVAGANNGPILSDYLSGGKIGGMIDFRNQMLDPTQNALGRLAEGLVMTINDQHALGLDVNGGIGGKFFSVAGLTGSPLTGLPSIHNAGSASVSFTVNTASALTVSDYRLDTGDGTNYTLRRLSDGAVLGTIVAGTPYSVDGMTINVTAGGVAGDNFQLEPTRGAARDISLVLNNTSQIAAASPLRSGTAKTNLGTGTVSKVAIDATTNLSIALGTTVSMAYSPTAPTGYDISIGGVATGVRLAYNPATQSGGANYDLGAVLAAGGYAGAATYNGVTFTLGGTPLNGDTFTIAKNTSAVGDNGNALILARLQSTKVFEGGTVDMQTTYSKMVSDTGSRTHQLDINNTAQKTVLDQAIAKRDAVSGVNLDEEAANLVKFQQAYQASAQMISAANTLFQTLLDAVR